MKQPTLARAWVFCFFGMHVAAYQLETAHAKDDAAVEAATQAKLHEAIAFASDNTMFLHLHTSVIGMLREHISIDVTG
ncbi:hypothetical protein A8E97_06735 [Burkholderia cenocepacia]|nr:hypothetical protein [Burkholderia cenocepacia]AQQ28963.1 hypothetical protein A8E88_26610 [Burkholderia cenocepacia]ONV84149.1 hypothetical protein A8E89_26815 [Burkholderia cenocepacia]ONW13151.1 hypothetical protein A8E94_16630 [Burkholderia cenocepacia]ONW18489.1 hypothetical protein A8E90_13430 [Burkholderia cenocepacia]ONW35347.1 hypothetical protein A8E99_27840 [Burkholderia cenocepacia]